jgi:hypothetical protein
MAYLYRHIRLDKNEPFYIGIGDNNSNNYKRAYSKQDRNKYWKNIIGQTPYEVEILLDNLTWDEACSKENEFIKLYGRADLNKGPLVNMTDGGEGQQGKIMSLEQKTKISQAKKGHSCFLKPKKTYKSKGQKLPRNQQWTLNFKQAKCKPIIQYDLHNNIIQEWESAKYVADQLNFNQSNINACLRNKCKTYKKFVWKYKIDLV